MGSIVGKLTNQVAVVTGASRGIGVGIAKALAGEGASVVVNYSSSKEGADLVLDEITAKRGRAIAVQGDVSKQADITRLFVETKKASGKLNILVNNAAFISAPHWMEARKNSSTATLTSTYSDRCSPPRKP